MHNVSTVITLAMTLSMASDAAGAEGAKSLYIEGYTDQLSYVAGDSIAFHTSTSALKYDVEIAREGAQREVVWTQADLPGAEHAVPDDASANGCRWPVAFRLTLPETWKSGYYSVQMRVADQGGAFTQRNRRTADGTAFFVVRPALPGASARILLQLSTNTYNAYNNWGGYSLYAYHGRNNVQGRRVSFDRPPSSQFFTWEQPFVAWAEANGYALDYAVNSDLEFHPELLKAYPLILSVGHDEYWSAPMRDHLEAYIAQGGNVAFFSGNAVCWQVRSEENGRALVCWKQAFKQDPLYPGGDHRLLSTAWSHYLVNRPENQLTGVGFLFGGFHLSHGQYMDGSGAFTVYRPDHWIFAGSGLKQGDTFGGKDTIVGYECDGCEFTMKDGLPEPTHRDGTPESFVILATAPARWHPDDCEWYERWEKGREGAAMLGIYHRGGTVVTTGTTDWAHGLRGPDPAVDRITRNVLDRLSK
jgi:N,N-dimethylformamidase beta subunit-like, C-terminal